MNPLGTRPFRQGIAHEICQAGKGFVPKAGLLHSGFVRHAIRDLICEYCYPSPFLRPDQKTVRPFFRQSAADRVAARELRFCLPANVVNCATIITQIRGDHRCVNPLSFFLWRHFRWPGAFRATANARWWARAWVQLHPKPLVAAPMMRFWQALPGLLQVHCATTQAFAADLTGHRPTIQDHPGATSGGLLHFWGTACLTRS
jgi:hypothetical protein